MKINQLALLFVMLIFFMFPFIAFAIDSTMQAIIPPPLTRQCFTVQPKDVIATVKATNCTWRGSNHKSDWGGAFGVSGVRAIYDQSCETDEIATGVKHGVRGVFSGAVIYGEFDLYVYCCKLDLKVKMTQEWLPCS